MRSHPLIIANWKMHHGMSDTIKFCTELSRSALPTDVDVAICPPFTVLYTLSVVLGDDSLIAMGAQNCHFEDHGAYTGEVSPLFLKEMSCRYVIVGHSERRQYFAESNSFIGKKIQKLLELDMQPVFCIGETLTERQSEQTFGVLEKQLKEAFAEVQADKAQLKNIVIAYEPVWAIGTGVTATPAQAQEVHAWIRQWLVKQFGSDLSQSLKIIYGGSVKPDNAKELMSQADIDGALVGGASLRSKDFCAIIHNSKR